MKQGSRIRSSHCPHCTRTSHAIMYVRGETGPTESMKGNRIGWKKESSFEERNVTISHSKHGWALASEKIGYLHYWKVKWRRHHILEWIATKTIPWFVLITIYSTWSFVIHTVPARPISLHNTHNYEKASSHSHASSILSVLKQLQLKCKYDFTSGQCRG